MMRWIKAASSFLLLLLLDQLTKFWAVTVLKPIGHIPLLSGVLEIYYVENRGAAFGILQDHRWFFLLITVAVLLGLVWLSRRIPGERYFTPLRCCLFFMGAGAVGNMIDRTVRRYVVDFIYFSLIDFPVFNVADIYVTVSAFFLVILVLFRYKDEDFERIFPKKNRR